MPASTKSSDKPPVVRPKLRACPQCGRKNQVGAVQCWLCLSWLEAGITNAPAPIVSPGPSTLRVLGIVFGTIGVIFATGIAVVIALFAICAAALSA